MQDLSKVSGDLAAKAAGPLINGAFIELASANRDLTDPLGHLPKLQIDKARELLEIVYSITRQLLGLIFDQ